MNARSTAMAAIFFGPAACAADQFFSYVLVDRAVASHSNLVLHVLTLLGAAVAAVGLVLSYRVLRPHSPPHAPDRQPEVDRFLALVGVVMNAFFLVVMVVGYGLPKLLLHATD